LEGDISCSPAKTFLVADITGSKLASDGNFAILRVALRGILFSPPQRYRGKFQFLSQADNEIGVQYLTYVRRHFKGLTEQSICAVENAVSPPEKNLHSIGNPFSPAMQVLLHASLPLKPFESEPIKERWRPKFAVIGCPSLSFDICKRTYIRGDVSSIFSPHSDGLDFDF
jgi:hypothetical protein